MAPTVLGIAGSARRGGNTEALLDRALEGAASAGATAEKVVLLDLRFSPCICPTSEDCLPNGICSVNDEMQQLYPRLLGCDLLFVASPVFFRGVTAQLKAMIDRCQALWVAKYRLGRPDSSGTPHRTARRKGLFVSVANTDDPKEFQGAILVIRSLFATLNVRYEAGLLFDNIERLGDIQKRPEALKVAFDTGARLAQEEMGSSRDVRDNAGQAPSTSSGQAP